RPGQVRETIAEERPDPGRQEAVRGLEGRVAVPCHEGIDRLTLAHPLCDLPGDLLRARVVLLRHLRDDEDVTRVAFPALDPLDLDDVEAEARLDDVADRAGRQGEGRALELGHHLAHTEPAEIAGALAA